MSDALSESSSRTRPNRVVRIISCTCGLRMFCKRISPPSSAVVYQRVQTTIQALSTAFLSQGKSSRQSRAAGRATTE